MKRNKQIEIDGRTVTVRELTVADVRNWLKELEQIQEASIDLVTEGLMGDASLADVVRMSDLAIADLDAMAPSEIETVMVACKEINPHFFKLRQRLTDAVQHLS